ncbi:cation:proton antiporter subunit C [Aquisalimonas sp. 2447]|uniref:cation:proton antiporter subunit C n=1 Tax=Aquisalimonas sp. 2447 TaxID=2740807 RepID=UPI00143246E3|nr:cation:proton antiporter subunit C [Aquisalimonas sp. 2447]QIT54963.1 cation:proton antiporter subunit C [Aquisalimonas sp. 2447]
MMPYLLLASGLFLIGCHGLFASEGMLRKLLALNVLSSAVFLLFVTIARMSDPLDPVPHAIVLTGLVVTVSTTAVALAIVIRLAAGGSDVSRGRREEDE